MKLESGVDVVDLVDSLAMKFDNVFTALTLKKECSVSECPLYFIAGTLSLSITQDEAIKLNSMLNSVKPSQDIH